MTISLTAVDIRHERRVRLLFSTPLAVGAYVPSLYTITSSDSASSPIGINAAMLVVGNPAVVELAFDADMAVGGQYLITAVGVPAVDASVTPAGSELSLRYGVIAAKENVEPIQRDRDRLLYGVDLLWDGLDYRETPTGDLERVGGTANVTKALYRVVDTNGLPWDPTWGVGARNFVDSPSAPGGTLRGQMISQILRDPRIKSVKVSVEFSGDSTFLYAQPKLVTGELAERVSLSVPSDI